MNQRAQSKASTRDAIIEAAAKEFAQHGYAGTSFASVASAMGRPKSAIGYHLFRSKKELASAVISLQQSRWVQIDSGIPQPEGPDHLLIVLFAACRDAMRCPIAAGAIRLIQEFRGAEEDIPATFVWDAYVRRHLRAAIAVPTPTMAPDWDRAADLLLTSTFGVMWARTGSMRPRDVEEQLRELWSALFTAWGLPQVRDVLQGEETLRCIDS